MCSLVYIAGRYFSIERRQLLLVNTDAGGSKVFKFSSKVNFIGMIHNDKQ